MASSRFFIGILLAVFTIVFAVVPPSAGAQSMAPAPVSDGTSVDQGLACVLMLAALVLTYLIHPLDASSYNFF
ncbi:hypothetical protein RHGRI_019002 [Rhododendron griersonianum]|uniref:Uncharacterized protein n=1 Tax=Rhododendron griersonianum TaxID=479676 RepID=A0AAV6JFR4_9ERIC|nr:hypothetical protein RHGRI_019002 [Rhododendron griersonianum]